MRAWVGSVLVLLGCAIDESGLGQDAGFDVAVDVGPKDVTVLDVLTNDVQVEDVALDVPPDVPPPPPCNLSSPFGTFDNLGAGVDTGAFESSPSLTSDELTIFFARDTGGGRLGLFYATRASTSVAFGAATELSISGSQSFDTAPFVVDGLTTLYFASARNGATHYDLYQASGNGTPDGWANVTLLTALSLGDPVADTQPWIASGTSEVWFASDRLGTLDLFVAQTTSSTPIVSPLSSTLNEDNHPTLSHDALTIFFGRTDTQSHVHVWSATRASTVAPFGAPIAETEFDSGNSSNTPGWLSVDGCRMYYTSDRGGGKGSSDVWMATRPP